MDWKILVCLLLAVSLAAVQGKTEMYIFFSISQLFSSCSTTFAFPQRLGTGHWKQNIISRRCRSGQPLKSFFYPIKP